MLFATVRAFIQKHRLLTPGQTLAVGVSGGPDSLALLHLLVRLRPEYDLDLRAAHLHHGLRASADGDAEFVSQIAKEWAVPCVVEPADVAALARANRLSIEEAGRQARYAFFTRLAPVVAVAHNADDQAETVLMHLLRGAGIGGLRGMLPKSSGQWVVGSERIVIRPLLATPRANIEAYCAAHGLQPRIDSTNADTTFFRNRLRHELIPFLETYTPNIRELLCRTADVAAGDYELVRGVIEKSWADTLAAAPGEAVAFDLHRWRALPLALQRALLREAIARLRPGLRDVDFAPVHHAVEWAQAAESGRTADLLAGLCVKIRGNHLVICAWPSPLRRISVGLPEGGGLGVRVNSRPLMLPGLTHFFNWQATATRLERWSLSEIESNPDLWTAFVDASLAPFTLRTRRAGDRFRPMGMGGESMKLSDFMINQKIPVDDRDRWPLLTSGDEVIWVCGYRLSERARVTGATKEVVRLKLSGK